MLGRKLLYTFCVHVRYIIEQNINIPTFIWLTFLATSANGAEVSSVLPGD